LTVLLLYLGTLCLCLGGIWLACRKTPWCWWTILLGTIGTVLRLLYVLNTSYTERAHDVSGHLEYIRYVAMHLALPSLREGWETFHPPLYYVTGAVWYRIGMMLGRAESLLTRDLQWGALCASAAVALIGIWIGWLLFPGRDKQHAAVLFGSVIAVFPGLIYFAARINNDVFVQLWIFLAMALTLLWWRNSKIRWWYLAVLATGLGVLSKGNALLFAPVLFGTLLCKPQLSWRKKLLHAIGGALLLCLVTGWFFGLRWAQGQSHIVENVDNLNDGLAVPNAVELFTEFNPLRLLRKPYNDPWDDVSGRQNFLEYLFRSAFFGEFDFGDPLRPLSTSLLLLALLLCIPMATGFWNAVRRHTRDTIPLWLTLLSFLGGHIGLRIISPFSPSQDFRYSFMLLLPCAAFVLLGIDALPTGWRQFYRTILLTFIGVCGVFIVLVATR
ncbi:MAG: glycosyltransferase family 39 protein, partial [Candidatus Peribacteraceae bacterium]|nr:glycosyltransferase family 39 protein [Candidatus Peribacteraceae bacterium]